MENSKFTTREDIEAQKAELREAILTTGKTKMPPAKIAKNCVYLVVVIFLLAILLSVVVSKVSGGIPNVFGMYIFQVETQSMEPTLNAGKVIVSVKPSSEKKVEVGDIVTFKTTKGQTVTHRIVEKVDGGYRTKGDNPKNSVDDEVLTFDRIIAVMLFKF
ncbi:MAG: signal peptidase I [Clostridia bacterium]